MAGSQFQFLHASDLKLSQPLGGMRQIPEEWIDPLLDAPYASLQNVIDIALSERVAFVLLTGDLIHFPTAPLRAVEFLRGELERLRAAAIPVYWLDGRLEQGAPFPKEFMLPDNVKRLASGDVQRVEVRRGKKCLASLVARPACGHSATDLKEMQCPRDGRFFVGLWYGDFEGDCDLGRLDQIGIDYWACGGRSNPLELDTVVPARYCGTPQGRLPSEHGPHGCLLVQADGTDIRSQFIETDVVRYQVEHLTLRGTENASQLLALMAERLRELRAEQGDGPRLLASWEIVDDGPVGRELRQYEGNERMLARVQKELHDPADDSVWTIGLRSSRAGIPTSLLEEDTILGEFVREVRQMHETGNHIWDARSYLPHGAADELAACLPLDDLIAREQLLCDAAASGMDLLSGDES